VCDTGLCPPPAEVVVTLQPGSHDHAFTWEGRNWNGPSDTMNPMGDYFPAGTYTLSVAAGGYLSDTSTGNPTFDVDGWLEIELTP
jgi:hypothetical protein